MGPLLKRSDAGRAVFVTSGIATLAYAYWAPYSVSKAALDVMVRTYAAETSSTAVRANLFNPGPTRTRMRALAMPGEDPMTLPSPEQVAEKSSICVCRVFPRPERFTITAPASFRNFCVPPEATSWSRATRERPRQQSGARRSEMALPAAAMPGQFRSRTQRPA